MNSVEVRGLCKSFGRFDLQDIDIDIPKGHIVGLIGENGAGKTTLIKCITGACLPDFGTVAFPGMPLRRIGVVFDECHLPQNLDGDQLDSVMSGLIPEWDGRLFNELMGHFGIPMDKKVREYSRGMKMKVQTAVALSQHPTLVIFDEATAGMDPAARDEFLDIVMDYMKDEEHSVLMSSHITSDLEKVADYLVFIHAGRVVLNGTVDSILGSYGIAKGSEDEVLALKDEIVRIRRDPYCTYALVDDREGVAEGYPELLVDPASLDDIMVMMIRGEAA